MPVSLTHYAFPHNVLTDHPASTAQVVRATGCASLPSLISHDKGTSLATHPDVRSEQEEQSNSDEELLAGALALMTAHAQANADDRCPLAHAISGHVLQLAQQPSLSTEFRVALSILAAHWDVLAADPSSQIDPQGDHHLWHSAPMRVQ